MSDSAPQVSVIIPAYNQAQFLADAIQSVLGQTYRDFEIIVVDDGSQDNTRQVVAQFGNQVRYFWQENKGLSAARNTALRHAQAEIIALLDSDDMWKPEFLEKMVIHLNCHPQAAAVYCGLEYVDSHGTLVGKPSLAVVPPAKVHETLIREGNWLVPCAVIFRRRLAEQVGLFDESIGPVADTDLWIKLSAHHLFVGLPEVLVQYRRHANNMTKDPKCMIDASRQQTEKMFGLPKGNSFQWSRLKRCAYIKLYRSGIIQYLAYGDVEESIRYFLRLIELFPNTVLTMGFWRGIARVHIPQEYQNDPLIRLDWTQVQRDVFGLLDALSTRFDTSSCLTKLYPRIKASAFLALADEAARATELRKTWRWLWRVARDCPPMVVSRPYWGTLIRSIIGVTQ